MGGERPHSHQPVTSRRVEATFAPAPPPRRRSVNGPDDWHEDPQTMPSSSMASFSMDQLMSSGAAAGWLNAFASSYKLMSSSEPPYQQQGGPGTNSWLKRLSKNYQAIAYRSAMKCGYI